MAIDTTSPPGPFHTTCITARPATEEEAQWDVLMMNAHPLGNAHFPGYSIKYVVELCGHAVALLCFSACAYHLADRDPHIGWSQAQCMESPSLAEWQECCKPCITA